MGVEVILHKAQTGARHSDVHRELGGDGVEPEVQLGSERSQIKLEMLHNTEK